MAVNLARSFLYWHRDGDIGFALATDRPDLLPADVTARIKVIELRPGEFGEGFSPKLHLDELAPAVATLFVDADCLCVGRLDVVFDRFAGRAVSVVGDFKSEGEWFGDVGALCRRFSVAALPKFNGGLYYIERGESSRAVYETARELEPLYDAIGLVRLRGRPNDELLMALAMAKHGCGPIRDDGDIMADPQAFPVGLRVDVLGGGAYLKNPPTPDSAHVAWNRLEHARPLVVHFLGYHTDRLPYRREELRLELRAARHWPKWAAALVAGVARSVPLGSKDLVKRAARPLYRWLFGVRAIRTSARSTT